MKYHLIFTLLLLPCLLNAQKIISEEMEVGDILKFKIDSEWSDVIVKNWSGSTLKVEGTASINNGLNDDSFSYRLEKQGSTLTMTSEIKDMHDLPKFATYQVKSKTVRRLIAAGEEFDWKGLKDEDGVSSITVGVEVEVQLTVYLPSNIELVSDLNFGDIDLVNCTNSMNIVTTHGHIQASFDKDLPIKCSLRSAHGFVDVTVPKSQGAQVSLHTNHGEIYTDLVLNHDLNKSTDQPYNSKIVATVNQGGNHELFLHATHDNIYLRGQ